MKIPKNIAFKISDENQALSSFKKIKTGGSVHAKILERLNTREAIIEISGKKVRVEFLKGVPKSGNLVLILEGRESNTYYFKILDKSNKSELLNRITDFTIFDHEDIENINISLLNKSLKEGLSGVYAYNILLMKALKKGNNDKNDRTANIIKKLISLGMKPENVIFLSMLLYSGKGLSFEQMLSLMMILRLAENYNPESTDSPYMNDKNINKKIENIFKVLDNITDLSVKKETVQEIIDNFLLNSTRETSGFSSGKILYIDDNDYKAVKYTSNADSIIISLNFSYLGNLEILIKNDTLTCNIAFFCENDKSIDALRSKSDILISNLNSVLRKSVNIFFSNKKEAAKKIIEIYSLLSLNKCIDVRV